MFLSKSFVTLHHQVTQTNTTMQNDTNNFAKRTAAQVNAILAANGIAHKAENLGDGNTFQVNASDLKLRIALKQAGFILLRSNAGDITLTFKTN